MMKVRSYFLELKQVKSDLHTLVDKNNFYAIS